jgi:hypothetical protein
MLIASAVFTVPARADSGSPPPAPTGGSSASSSTTTTVSQIPTTVTNVAGGDGGGHKVKLESQKAAYSAEAGDPIWCPATVAVPVAGAAGCSIALYNSNLYTLTNAVQTGLWTPVVTNSNVWILGGADSSASQIYLNGSTLPGGISTLDNFTLTFKGGWTGIGGGINPAIPSVFSGVGFSIGSWNNNVSMSNITINNSPSTQDDVYIYSTKNINLTNIVGFHGGNYGAYLDNSAGTGVTISNSSFNQNDQTFSSWGVYVLSGGPITLTNFVADKNLIAGGAYLDNSGTSNKPVTIKNSYFDNNIGYYGLEVLSQGAITLSNVSASGNSGAGNYGASLNNTASITAAPVTLSGTNFFDSNGGDGLDISSLGKITSGPISANNNGAIGAQIENTSAVTALPLTLTGTSSFNDNGADGLNLWSEGAITANNLSANGNGGQGAYLYNEYSFTVPIKVTGTNLFTNNGSQGLLIDSYGAISLNNITANANGTAGSYDGLYAENKNNSTPQKITLTGINNFNLNSKNGAEILSSGAVSVINVTAIGNVNATGLTIDNSFLGFSKPQSVTVLGTNLFTNNKTDNLDIKTYGNITVNNLTASNSLNGVGAYLGSGGITAGNVTLNGLNAFNANAAEGLVILSSGSVLTNGLNALSNASSGVVIDNSSSTTLSPVKINGLSTINFNGSGLTIVSKGAVVTNGLNTISNTGAGVTVVNTASSLSSPVTLNGLNNINKNGSGLTIVSNGAVVTYGLNAISNVGGAGVTIVNTGSTTSSPVTLNGLSTINFNGSGLTIVSKGNVLTNGLNLISNLGTAATIVNSSSTTAAKVTLNGTSTINFNSSGMTIVTNGVVLTNGLSVNSNNGTGASIVNSSSIAFAPVTLKGINTFNNNAGTGLDIVSVGAVSTSGLSALNNSSDGVNIVNSSASTSVPVTLNGLSTINFNGSDGLYISTHGAMVTNGLIALNNVSDGVYINNGGSLTSAPVTLKGANTFNFNGSDGLYLSSKGTVSTNSLKALNNSSDGAYINNSSSSILAPVTLNGLSTFNNNSSDGLYISSNGNVTTNGLNALNNGSDGAYINNSSSTSASVTLKGVNTFNNNSSDGLYLSSRGAILTNSLNALNNGSDGAYIFNASSTIFAPITLNGSNTFNNNSSYGLYLSSTGKITANNLTANTNGSIGAYLQNNSFGSTGGINLKGNNNFLDNGDDGLDLHSLGVVTVSNISSKYNYYNGFFVNTPGNVIVTCGKFISNGTSHTLGYGWETGTNVPSIKLIGVTSVGNYGGDSHLVNGATVVTNVPKTCNLP